MSGEIPLSSTLASLKFITASPLLKTHINSRQLTKCVKKFKTKLIESLDSNQLSDNFLKNVSECLYDLKASDLRTSYYLSRTFEGRPGIISNQLKGGFLWAYHNNQAINRARRKVISASCRVAIKQAIREFLDLKGCVTNISRFDSILRNLKIVGDCYRVPISPKTRLQQSILESSEVLSLCLECFPLLLPMCKAFCSLLIDDEKIAKVVLDIFCDHLQKDDLLTLNEISGIMRVLYKWKISRVDKQISCLEIFKEFIENSKFEFYKNSSSSIKLFTSSIRLPKSSLSYELSRLILIRSGSVVTFCSNSDLVLFFNSVSQFKKSYPEAEITGFTELVANLETYLQFENPDFRKGDLVTIQRSCTILKHHLDISKLLEITTGLNNSN